MASVTAAGGEREEGVCASQVRREGGRRPRIEREFKSGKSVKVLLTALLCAASIVWAPCSE